MPSLFDPLVKWMIEQGFYSFLFPWIITSAVFYGLLRKSKIFGESPALNGIVSISIAFLIIGFPFLSRFNLILPMSTFFTQATVFLLILVIGFMFASLFYPDLPKFLLEKFTRRTTLGILIVLGITLFITSGLVGVFTYGIGKPAEPGAPSLPTDVIILASGIIIFIVLIIIAGSIVMGGEQ